MEKKIRPVFAAVFIRPVFVVVLILVTTKVKWITTFSVKSIQIYGIITLYMNVFGRHIDTIVL